MKKIINPWRDHPEYNCFGCCPENPIGLHMDFYEDGDYIVSKWTAKVSKQVRNLVYINAEITNSNGALDLWSLCSAKNFVMRVRLYIS